MKLLSVFWKHFSKILEFPTVFYTSSLKALRLLDIAVKIFVEDAKP